MVLNLLVTKSLGEIENILQCTGAASALKFIAAYRRTGNTKPYLHGLSSCLKKDLRNEDVRKSVFEKLEYTPPEPGTTPPQNDVTANKLLSAIKSRIEIATWIEENDPGAWIIYRQLCEQKKCEGSRRAWARRVLDTNDELEAML